MQRLYETSTRPIRSLNYRAFGAFPLCIPLRRVPTVELALAGPVAIIAAPLARYHLTMPCVPPKVRRSGGLRLITARHAQVLVSLICAAGAGLITWSGAASASKDSPRAEVSELTTSKYGAVLVVGSGRLRGFPLYAFTGDAGGKFRCGTTLASGYDLGPDSNMPLTCTGPESDLTKGVKSDDWPAFTTKGAPVAGPGVNPRLLGTVERPGIGDQVTYGGHPLYLFDPVSEPFDPQGEGYIETVKPLAPWHGYWFLVSSANGEPSPGTATIETGVLKNGKKVLAVEVDENVSPIAATVYRFSRDRPRVSTCVRACAVTWVPVLTMGPPHVIGDIARTAVGVIRRANGTEQVTYDGAPLYLYAKEKVSLTPVRALQGSGTAGNGEDVRGPYGGTFTRIPLAPASA
jgi:predicted lipoprotein with Yx(FWY)xxD motif